MEYEELRAARHRLDINERVIGGIVLHECDRMKQELSMISALIRPVVKCLGALLQL